VPNPDPPTVMVSADLEGGGRFYGQLTDCDPATVGFDMPVELCFRRIHEGEGFISYRLASDYFSSPGEPNNSAMRTLRRDSSMAHCNLFVKKRRRSLQLDSNRLLAAAQRCSPLAV
jgi:acyl-CoA-associated DUF35 OB-fold domain-containing protein